MKGIQRPMETQTTVRSYVRGNKQATNLEQEPKESNAIAYILGGMAIVSLAIVYWQVSIPVALVGGAGYALTHMTPSRSIKTIEDATKPVEKPKRHYERRIYANILQTNGSIKKVRI